MKRILIAAGAAAALCLAGGALAQVPFNPNTPNILTWRGDQQATGFRSTEKIYHTHIVRRGDHVHPLPKANRTLAPSWTFDGKSWDVASYMKANRVSGLLVIKDGKILLERYGLGRGPADRWVSFSVTKSVTSTLVGAAIKDGKIKGPDALVVDYIPELKGSAYEGVTVRQMLMMSSGVKWNEDYTDPKSDVAQAGTKILEPGVDPMVSYLRKLPREAPAGAKFHYNTGETDLVGILVSNAVGKPLADYLSEKIWKPYGMEEDATWMTDPADRERGGCCIAMTLRDYGRFGQFVLDGAKINGEPIVPEGWLRDATRVEIDNGEGPKGGYGYFWWIGGPDEYSAYGIFGQSITTFPRERLIIVQNAAWPVATGKAQSAAEQAMSEAIFKAAMR